MTLQAFEAIKEYRTSTSSAGKNLQNNEYQYNGKSSSQQQIAQAPGVLRPQELVQAEGLENQEQPVQNFFKPRGGRHKLMESKPHDPLEQNLIELSTSGYPPILSSCGKGIAITIDTRAFTKAFTKNCRYNKTVDRRNGLMCTSPVDTENLFKEFV